MLARTSQKTRGGGTQKPLSRAANPCHLQHSSTRSERRERPRRTVMSATPPVSIVLVHGGFVDGSGWRGVYDILKRDGYKVSVVQNPTLTLRDDVAVTTRAIESQPGPVILVGHSYGGVVITEAGNHPQVVGLAYIGAFAPDKGGS